MKNQDAPKEMGKGESSLFGALDRVPRLENEINFTAVRAMEKAEEWESVF